jgi:hypothetical protein
MQYDYVLTLKRDNARRTDLVSFLLLIFSILAFVFFQIRNGLSLYQCMAIVILIAGLVINLRAFMQKKEMRFRNWIFIAGICWIGMPFLQWLALPFFLLGFLEIQSKYPLEIAFYSGGIVLNTLFKKKIQWNLLHSVILKDGLLTLDFKNNRLFQKEVPDDDEPDADEDEFNDYCRSKLVNLH